MSGTSGIFTGSSRYSSDFQSIIDRTVGIASLPMMQMQNIKNDLSARSTALSSLDSKVAALQTAINGLSSGLGSGSYSASVSDTSVARATTVDGAREGVYSIEVTRLGSQSNTLSKASGPGLQKVTDPATGNLSGGATFHLYLNGDPTGITITPASNSLNALADAINLASPDVHATVVNVGGSSGADYRLSIQHNKLGANTIQLGDDSGNTLLDQPVTGQTATYKVNGSDESSSDTRSIALAPGLTVDLLKQSDAGVATTITVSRNAAAIGNALRSFANAYNAVVDELDNNRGSGSGALKGDSTLASITQSLRNIAGYQTGSGGIDSLTALGLNFDDKGKLSLDTAAFNSATKDNFAQLTTFLGSATGGGFLQTATDTMNGLEDSTNGVLKAGIDLLKTEMADQDNRIATEQDRVDKLKADTQSRMAAADALIAQMEQQVTYFTNMFDSMKNTNTGYGN
jgi:flagellar hook-associated protein 2